MTKSWVCACVLSLMLPLSAFAQDDEFGLDPEAGDTNNPEATEVIDENPTMEGDLPPEASTKDQWLVGVQWRQLIIPAFVQQVFLDEAPTVFQPTFQIVATKRNSDNFSLVFGLGYASYAFDGLYRAKGDPVQDTEMLNSNLGLLHGTFTALWAANINEVLDFEYGLGGDLGIVFGKLRRSEAYQDNGNWRACSGQFSPPTLAPTGVPYCNQGSVAYDEDGEHYNVVEKRIPPVFLLPTLFQVGLRITPIPQLAIKVEAAYATLAFWFGASVHVNLSQM